MAHLSQITMPQACVCAPHRVSCSAVSPGLVAPHTHSHGVQRASVRTPFSGTQIRRRSPQYSSRRAGRAASSSQSTVSLVDIESDTWKSEVLEADTVVLVDFWATWCGPCKLVLPAVKAIAQDFSGVLKVVKVEADPNPDLMEKYKVYGLPTLILFKDGEEIPGSKWEGAITKAKIITWLEKNGVVPAQ